MHIIITLLLALVSRVAGSDSAPVVDSNHRVADADAPFGVMISAVNSRSVGSRHWAINNAIGFIRSAIYNHPIFADSALADDFPEANHDWILDEFITDKATQIAATLMQFADDSPTATARQLADRIRDIAILRHCDSWIWCMSGAVSPVPELRHSAICDDIATALFYGEFAVYPDTTDSVNYDSDGHEIGRGGQPLIVNITDSKASRPAFKKRR